MSTSRRRLNILFVILVTLLLVLPGTALAAPAAAPTASAVAIGDAGHPPPAPPPLTWGYCWYRVRWGDTLANIAWHHYTTAAQLQRINGLPNPNRIYAGQVLRVPCRRR
jgi:nucleoid-associated protein YgaU